MAQKNLDYAMRRYNQSWLLNPKNYQPYWGFGRVMLERNRVDEAIKHLEKAKQLIDDDYQKPALIADLGSTYWAKAETVSQSEIAQRAHYFGIANENFAKSVALDASYSNGWRRWAMSLYGEGKYADAWDKVKEARSRGARPFPPLFIKALEQKMPEPK